MIHSVNGFDIVNKVEGNVFLELSCFLDDSTMLAIWFLFPLPFLNPRGGNPRGNKNTQKNYARKIFMTQITMMVWSLT